MLIGQISKRTGLSRDTIRYYEKQGLIPKALKENQFNSYKNYTNETLEKLLVIKKLKGFGFTLNEICDFLELMKLNSATCEIVSEKFLIKIKLIDNKIKELKEMKSLVIDVFNSCPSPNKKSNNCPLISVDY